jgi:hypothetical protein
MHEAAGSAVRPAQTGGVAPTTPAAPASAAPAAQPAPVAPTGQPQNLFQVSTLTFFKSDSHQRKCSLHSSNNSNNLAAEVRQPLVREVELVKLI